MESDESRSGSSGSSSSSSDDEEASPASFGNTRAKSESKSSSNSKSSSPVSRRGPKSPVNDEEDLDNDDLNDNNDNNDGDDDDDEDDDDDNNRHNYDNIENKSRTPSLRSPSPEDENGYRSRSGGEDSDTSDNEDSIPNGNINEINNENINSPRSSSVGGDDIGSPIESNRNTNVHNQNRSVSRNQSMSPVRGKTRSRSSRASSVSSNSDNEDVRNDGLSDCELDSDKERNFLSDNLLLREDVDKSIGGQQDTINIRHEDLSDVSDIESTVSDDDDERNAGDSDAENIQEIDKIHINEHTDERDKEDQNKKSTITDLRQKLDERKNHLKTLEDDAASDLLSKMDKTESDLAGAINDNRNNNKNDSTELLNIMDKKNDEDALDFEAEEGECNEVVKEDKIEVKEPEGKKDSEGEVEEAEELEEGEVSDEDEKRPEETEPKPVCRFYTRGQCTWGMSCRFLHPGVTDKGNYTMFDMIRPVPITHPGGPFGPPGFHDFRNERPPIPHGPPVHHPVFGNRPIITDQPVVETAWERGLRTAKEMMRKANKRKEQDMDFEDKKMNLSASQDELEKDNYYVRSDRPSPEASPPSYNPSNIRPTPYDGTFSPQPKYPVRGAPPIFDEDPYGRAARYRELPPHRMPQYEDEIMGKRRNRPAREVIVQKVDSIGRGDEWNDPWMRSKSPGRGDKRGRRRSSYSSNSSYSSSSTSRSGSSSDSSRSPSPNTRRNRYNNIQGVHLKASPMARRHPIKRSPSPTQLQKPRRHSPALYDSKKDFKTHLVSNETINNNIGVRRTPPPAVRKRHVSPPLPEKRLARNVSPPVKRKRVSPPPPAGRKNSSVTIDKSRRKKRSSSSDSSGSESGSSYSSSSSSSTHGKSPVKTVKPRDKTILERKVVGKKVEMTKKRSPVVIPDVKSSSSVNQINSVVPPSQQQQQQLQQQQQQDQSFNNSKKITRREELLKQLRAVEDAIARKRSKLT